MIAYNIVFSHFPTTTLTFGSNIHGGEWTVRYGQMERVQMTLFCIQEVLLSSLYLYYIKQMTLDKKFTKLVQQTLVINVFVLGLDLSMLVVEYADQYDYQIMLKVFVYSVKLKLEYYILNVLTKSLMKNQPQAELKETGHASHVESGVYSKKAVVVSPYVGSGNNADQNDQAQSTSTNNNLA